MIKCSTDLYEKSNLNGHICEITHIGTYTYDGPIDVFTYYDIKWLPKENPGKSCDIDPIDFYWFEGELLPLTNSRVQSIVTSEGLPDF